MCDVTNTIVPGLTIHHRALHVTICQPPPDCPAWKILVADGGAPSERWGVWRFEPTDYCGDEPDAGQAGSLCTHPALVRTRFLLLWMTNA